MAESNIMDAKVGKRGTVTIPQPIRERFGIEVGNHVIFKIVDDRIILMPAVIIPVETYSLQRKAELLLNNAVDAEDYARVIEEVKRMGFDPDDIPHKRPNE